MPGWIARHKETLEAYSAIATAAGTILAFVGLVFAGIQAQRGALAIEASTLAQIQRDGRELRALALKDSLFLKCVEDIELTKTKCNAIELNTVRGTVGIILQYYSSIYNQKALGSLSNETWDVSLQDLCAFVKNETVKQLWTENFSNAVFRKEFSAAVNKCIGVTK